MLRQSYGSTVAVSDGNQEEGVSVGGMTAAADRKDDRTGKGAAWGRRVAREIAVPEPVDARRGRGDTCTVEGCEGI